MSEIWIKNRGTVSETDASALIKQYCDHAARTCCAFYTDHFQSAAVKDAQDGNLQKLLDDIPLLLEIRVFDRESELYLFRSGTGRDFSFRIADDRVLLDNLGKEGDPFLKKAESHRTEQVQMIDLDAGYKPYTEGKTDPYGSTRPVQPAAVRAGGRGDRCQLYLLRPGGHGNGG